MTVEVRPAVEFEDVRAVVGPKSPQANVCWCLSYRIPSALNRELRGPARGEYVAG
ncbi:GNAT family N-acetyltransferase, partial [Streptomyces pseudogriseolus]